MPNCVFCRIVEGSIPSKKVYEDAEVLGFEDLKPQAPVHLLLIPKRHVETVADLPPGDGTVSRLVERAVELARQRGIERKGFRLVLNCREDGGQTVYHLHLHLLGGRFLTWPPG